MTRTRLALPNLPLFLLAAAVVAALAFGVTRWVADAGSTLPPLAVAGDRAASRPGALDATSLFEQRVDTTVTIAATINGEPMNGAGVVVDAKNGIIITASHVVFGYKAPAAEATSVVVRFKRGDEVTASIEALDQFNDLAILKIDPSELAFPLVAAPLAANSDSVLVGSEVAAIGAPYGYDWTMTTGNVNSVHEVIGSRINDAYEIPDAIQFDASINKGNSGGPLFNARGEVIGITQQIATPNEASAGVAFAVSSNLVAHALRSWRETGRISHADLGIDARTVTPQINKAAGLGTDRGAVVQDAYGPAATAQLATGPKVSVNGTTVAAGDVVVEIAGRKVESREDLARAAGLIDPTQSVQITYLRRGERHQTTLAPSVRTVV